MTRLTFQEAVLKGYTQFHFKGDVHDLNEKNYNSCIAQKSDKNLMYLVDTDLNYSMKIIPEQVIYNATEDLFSGCYDKVTGSKEFRLWKKQTEDFLKSMESITTSYNVTDIELV